MKTRLVVAILLMGIGTGVFAYPITPRPLRKLIMESEYIVYADVIRIENVKIEEHRTRTKAILAVKEILQGNVTTDTIGVFFIPGMICPAPATYIKGSMVLAFLDKREKGYTTHALSYGSKMVDPAGFLAYKSRILEMQKILALANEGKKAEKTIDWLIACATNPHTRWEGIYELSPHSDFMSYYDAGRQVIVGEYYLSDKQKTDLREAFFEIEDLTYTDLGLIDLVVEKNDTELIDFLIKKLRETDLEHMWYKDFLMWRIAEFTDRDDLRKIVQEMEEIDYSDENREEKERELAREFIGKL